MTDKLKVHDHLECFGRKVTVVSNGHDELGHRQPRIYSSQRFPFGAMVIEKADSQWRKIQWTAHLTVFNTPIPLAQIDFKEDQEPDAAVKLLDFQALELIKDMSWFLRSDVPRVEA